MYQYQNILTKKSLAHTFNITNSKQHALSLTNQPTDNTKYSTILHQTTPQVTKQNTSSYTPLW